MHSFTHALHHPIVYCTDCYCSCGQCHVSISHRSIVQWQLAVFNWIAATAGSKLWLVTIAAKTSRSRTFALKLRGVAADSRLHTVVANSFHCAFRRDVGFASNVIQSSLRSTLESRARFCVSCSFSCNYPNSGCVEMLLVSRGGAAQQSIRGSGARGRS